MSGVKYYILRVYTEQGMPTCIPLPPSEDAFVFDALDCKVIEVEQFEWEAVRKSCDSIDAVLWGCGEGDPKLKPESAPADPPSLRALYGLRPTPPATTSIGTSCTAVSSSVAAPSTIFGKPVCSMVYEPHTRMYQVQYVDGSTHVLGEIMLKDLEVAGHVT